MLVHCAMILHTRFLALSSQFNCRPTEGSEKALAQVLAYLNCTTDFALCGSGDSGLSVSKVETAMSNLNTTLSVMWRMCTLTLIMQVKELSTLNRNLA